MYTKKENFPISLATTEEIKNKIIRPTGPNELPAKMVKISANVIDSSTENIAKYDITNNAFSENAKKLSVRPIFK